MGLPSQQPVAPHPGLCSQVLMSCPCCSPACPSPTLLSISQGDSDRVLPSLSSTGSLTGCHHHGNSLSPSPHPLTFLWGQPSRRSVESQTSQGWEGRGGREGGGERGSGVRAGLDSDSSLGPRAAPIVPPEGEAMPTPLGHPTPSNVPAGGQYWGPVWLGSEPPKAVGVICYSGHWWVWLVRGGSLTGTLSA